MSRVDELLDLHTTVIVKTAERLGLLIEINFALGQSGTDLDPKTVDIVYDSCVKEANDKDLWLINYSCLDVRTEIRNRLANLYDVFLDYDGTLICSRMNAK